MPYCWFESRALVAVVDARPVSYLAHVGPAVEVGVTVQERWAVRRSGRRPRGTVPQLVRADHHDGQPGAQQRLDDRAVVRSFDRDLGDADSAEPADQPAQAVLGVRDRPALTLTAGPVDTDTAWSSRAQSMPQATSDEFRRQAASQPPRC